MRKTAVLLTLILVLLAASLVFVAKPASEAEAENENSWTIKSPIPQGGAVYGAAAVEGKIYAFGAYYYGADLYKATTYYTSGKYDPATDTWTTAIAQMPTPRIEFATAVHENKIYIIGGKETRGSASLNTVEVYDPATNSWASGAPMPTARDSMQASVVSGKIYVISGQISLLEAHPGAIFSDAVEVYDPTSNTWASAPNIPNHVADYSSAVIDNRIYILGGATEEPGIGWHAINTTQIYDPATNLWSFWSPLSKAVAGGLAYATTEALTPRRVYVFGGYGENASSSDLNQVYDPITNEWVSGAKQSFHGELAGTALKDVMYVFGGSFRMLSPIYQTANYWDKESYHNPPPPFPAINCQYTPIGYGTTDRTAPRITLLSPENKTYPPNSVSVAFIVDEPTSWMGYRLDGQQITAIDSNITLNGLASGSHNISFYAKDTSENTGASEIVAFIVAVPEPFPVVSFGATASVIAAATGLLLYFKKRPKGKRT